MFTFELPNTEAEMLIDIWGSTSNITASQCVIVQQQGYTHIRWLYSAFGYDRATFDFIQNPILSFRKKTKVPYIFISEELGNYIGAYTEIFNLIFLSPSMQVSFDFNWSQQLERYRVALLLKATE